CFWACYVLFKGDKNRPPLPPGPTPIPLLGNLLQIPGKKPLWESVAQWSEQYGPIMSFKVASRTIIILSTRETTRDVLEKKAKITGSRPRFIGVNENLTRSLMPVFLPMNDKWESVHQTELSLMNPRTAKGIASIQLAAAKQLLFNMLENKDYDITSHINRFASNVVSTTLFGTDIGSVSQAKSNSKYGIADQLIDSICVEHTLVDLFPVLENIPGIKQLGASRGNAWFEDLERLYTEDIQLAIKSPRWSIAKAAHQQQRNNMTDEAFRMWIVEAEFALGMTSSMLTSNMAALAALHPNEFHLVQSEIDQVVGQERLPTVEDLDYLPRLNAFVKETMRMKPVAPFSVPHAASEETVYRGYRIPPDAILLPNQWHINREVTYFNEPDSFKPQRWIDNPDLPDPALFGYGRRTCPGSMLSA
ncbi:hypothetical protein BBP40_008221, partial [Aspergillus hancockii]